MPLRVGLAGLGAIGIAVARRLALGVDGLSLSAAAAKHETQAHQKLRNLGLLTPVLPLARLPQEADVIVECLPPNLFTEIAVPTLELGKVLVSLTVGGLLEHPELFERAKRSGGRIIVPSGAILGLDALAAAREGKIHSVRIITRKPPKGLQGAPYLERNSISVVALNRSKKVFDGTVREAIAGFPSNVNVAVAVSLAGPEPDKTLIEIWADPALTKNTHYIEVVADSASFSMTIENMPSDENPKTGKITPLSVIATLRKMTSVLQVGT